MNKKAADFQEFIFTYKSHIIVGTETWLSTSICSYLVSGIILFTRKTDLMVMVVL